MSVCDCDCDCDDMSSCLHNIHVRHSAVAFGASRLDGDVLVDVVECAVGVEPTLFRANSRVPGIWSMPTPVRQRQQREMWQVEAAVEALKSSRVDRETNFTIAGGEHVEI